MKSDKRNGKGNKSSLCGRHAIQRSKPVALKEDTHSLMKGMKKKPVFVFDYYLMTIGRISIESNHRFDLAGPLSHRSHVPFTPWNSVS